jgi:Na+:H+ antiporter, NhaA family
MIVPAGIYWMCNIRGFVTRGWGILVATYIAFALGGLVLIAPDAPIGARVFLTVLAIVDGMGAVLVIAIFYSHAIACKQDIFAGSLLAGVAEAIILRAARHYRDEH